MASNSTKSFLADAGYGEQELDANSALMELDKGIRKSALSGATAWGKVAPPGGGSLGRGRGKRMRTSSLGGECFFWGVDFDPFGIVDLGKDEVKAMGKREGSILLMYSQRQSKIAAESHTVEYMAVIINGGQTYTDLQHRPAVLLEPECLRSGKLGEQCEAVVRFPRLFQKYPFPILINSAFLKLADVFRVGNNFLRLCVLKVTQQSEKHLEKILNVDEFVKRIFSVIHSNDPVARAITLRMLGSLASIIPERKNAHHSIRQSLDSHDNVEVEAAVFAAANFSAQSKDFAVGICNKISEMIQGLATPVDLKLKLIPILQHMHHDAILASSARQLLQQLVTSYPSTKMVIVSLHTFTLLAASSLVDTPKQIQLLLQYLKNDPRKAVKRLAIQDLKLLANKTPHTWSKENIQALCECALQTPYDSLKLGMLSVLSTLSGTIAIKHYFSTVPGCFFCKALTSGKVSDPPLYYMLLNSRLSPRCSSCLLKRCRDLCDFPCGDSLHQLKQQR
ncbi:Integrator complex subunit 7 [Saguinus oedipus]|uniref:Integrator complex subunit 7 n=1 Tax=Saguinus oedipus TaxID=9490 RepID=A0ABQ9TPB9_SAGOE|nr:Integrator complex subunit 7 [Saguinus oedipus]